MLAYVLLTGFTPFGGDTDQETLRNITTPNLEVDFPQELFEGVSDMAKDFIRVCLNRHGCQMARARFLDRMCLAFWLLDYGSGSATLRCKV